MSQAYQLDRCVGWANSELEYYSIFLPSGTGVQFWLVRPEPQYGKFLIAMDGMHAGAKMLQTNALPNSHYLALQFNMPDCDAEQFLAALVQILKR